MLDQQEIFNNFNEGFGCWSPGGRLLKANAAFLRMMGFRTGEPFSGGLDAAAISHSFSKMSRSIMQQFDLTDEIKNFEIHLPQETGSRWLRADARCIGDKDGKPLYYAAYLTDITRLKLKEAELSNLIFYDALTALPNRSFFINKIETALQIADRYPDQYAFICIVLDDLININQHYGRNFGDMLLRHTAATLLACCRATDTMGRIGIDSFGILLRDPESGRQLVKIIKRIRSKLETPFAIWKERLESIPAYIGVIFPLGDYSNPESVLRDAGIAANKAKTTSSNLACKFFSKKNMQKSRDELSMSVILQKKRHLKGFSLVYQPIVHPSGGLHSFEALVRWSHNGKPVSPATFIPVAEQTGFIKKLGDFVIETACRQLRRWQDENGSLVNLHINISPHQLIANDFTDKVNDILHHTGVDSSRLFFEVTESIFLRSFEKALHNINILRRQGIRFCLDDFGTGYSSLSYLKMLPVECLKIDRSFILDLEKDAASKILLSHIVALGMDMGCSLVVEGVERQTQLSLLSDDSLLIQGFYFYRPLPACEADALLEEPR